MVWTHNMNWVMLLQLAVCALVVRCAPATTRFESIWHGGKNGCSNPCENIGANICSTQGVCVRDGCGWNCRCYAGYTGKFCEERVFSAAPVSSANKKTYDPIVNGNILDMLDQTLRDSTTSSTTASTTLAETISTTSSTASTSLSVQSTTSAAITPWKSMSMAPALITSTYPTTTTASVVTSSESSTVVTASRHLLTTALPRSPLLLVPLSILGVFNWKSAAVTKSLTGEMNTIQPSHITKTASLKTVAESRTRLEKSSSEIEPTIKSADITRGLKSTAGSTDSKTVSRKQGQITSELAEIPTKPRVNSNTKLNRESPKRQGKIVLGAMHPRSEDVILPIDSIPTIEHLLNAEAHSSVPTNSGDSTHQSNATDVSTQETHMAETVQNRTPKDSVTQDQTQAPRSVEINDDETNTSATDSHNSNDNTSGIVDNNQNVSAEEVTVVGQHDFSDSNGNSDSNNNEEKGQTNNTSNVNGQEVSDNIEPILNKSDTIKTDNGHNSNESNISNGLNTTEVNFTLDNATNGNHATRDTGNGDKRATSDNGTGGSKSGTDVTHSDIFPETRNHDINSHSQNGDNGNKTSDDNGNSKPSVDSSAINKGITIRESSSNNHNITENRIQKDNTGPITGKSSGPGYVDRVQQKQTYTMEVTSSSNTNGDNKAVATESISNADSNGHIHLGSSNSGKPPTAGHQRTGSEIRKTVNSSNISESSSRVKDINTEVHSLSNLRGNGSDNGNGGTSYSVTSNGQSESSTSSPKLKNSVSSVKSSVQPNTHGDPPPHGDRTTHVGEIGSKGDPVEQKAINSGVVQSRGDSSRGTESNGSGGSNGMKEETGDNNNSHNTLRHSENGNGHSISKNGGD